MSRDGRTEADFADGHYTFRLAWGELEKLQDSLDCGPLVVLDRLQTRQWKIRDVREIIRLGLIGGGLDAAKALKLVRGYVEDDGSLIANAVLAFRILGASLVGAPDEPEEPSPPGKAEMPSESIASKEANSASA